MEKIPQHLEDKLNRYLDGVMSASEKLTFESDLQRDEALKTRLDQLRIVDQSLRNIPLETPSRNFTQLVMGRLDQYPRYTTTPSLRNGIFLLAGVLVAIGLAAFLVSAGVFDSASTTLDLNKINIPTKYVQRSLPSIPFNGKLMVNIIIVVNLVLGWIVLDRAILKPYFQRRLSGEVGDR